MSLGSKPPLPKGKVATDSLEEITNKVFDDLLDNKVAAAHNFDELGVLDPERKVFIPYVMHIHHKDMNYCKV